MMRVVGENASVICNMKPVRSAPGQRKSFRLGELECDRRNEPFVELHPPPGFLTSRLTMPFL